MKVSSLIQCGLSSTQKIGVGTFSDANNHLKEYAAHNI
jgi:hypothetical protein